MKSLDVVSIRSNSMPCKTFGSLARKTFLLEQLQETFVARRPFNAP
jgi:hypothetical protein